MSLPHLATRAEILGFIENSKNTADPFSDLSPRAFEALVAYLLESLGFSIYAHELLSPHEGIDIVAEFQTPIGNRTAIVECKHMHSTRAIEPEAVARLRSYAEAAGADDVILVTNSRRTTRAMTEAARIGSPAIQVIGFDEMVSWMKTVGSRPLHGLSEVIPDLGSLPVGKTFQATQKIGAREDIILPEEFRSKLQAVSDIPLEFIKRVIADPRTLYGVDPRLFEKFVAELVHGLGFNDVLLTPRSGDGGKDVIASKLIEGIPVVFFFECKKYALTNKVKPFELRALLGTVTHERRANKGVLVTTSTFTKGSHKFLVNESTISGKDYAGLVTWINDYAKRYGFRAGLL